MTARRVDMLSSLLHGWSTRFAKFPIAVGILVVECGRLLLFVLIAATCSILFLLTYSAMKLARLRILLWSVLEQEK